MRLHFVGNSFQQSEMNCAKYLKLVQLYYYQIKIVLTNKNEKKIQF